MSGRFWPYRLKKRYSFDFIRNKEEGKKIFAWWWSISRRSDETFISLDNSTGPLSTMSRFRMQNLNEANYFNTQYIHEFFQGKDGIIYAIDHYKQYRKIRQFDEIPDDWIESGREYASKDSTDMCKLRHGLFQKCVTSDQIDVLFDIPKENTESERDRRVAYFLLHCDIIRDKIEWVDSLLKLGYSFSSPSVLKILFCQQKKFHKHIMVKHLLSKNALSLSDISVCFARYLEMTCFKHYRESYKARNIYRFNSRYCSKEPSYNMH